jgi:hypothetical protein
MKISVNYKKTDNTILKVDSAQYLTDFAITIKFSDGTERLVDFKPFLSKSIHPSIKKYADKNYFTNFKIIDGNLNWNDYDLIFPVWDLYNGKI